MFTNRKTLPSDYVQIKANKFLDEDTKKLMIKAWGTYKAETLLKGEEIIAIAVFNQFHPRLFTSGIVIKENVSITELKKIKQFIKHVISNHNADYVYSECVTCPVRDRFHEFLGFEVEKDLDTFKKWKFKGLLY